MKQNSFIGTSDLVPALLGGSIGGAFPVITLLLSMLLPDGMRDVVYLSLGKFFVGIFTSFVALCPSTRDPSGLGPSNECLLLVPPFLWLLSVCVGACIGILVGRLQIRRRNARSA